MLFGCALQLHTTEILFPYTTLFRSLPLAQGGDVAAGGEDLVELGGDGPGERRPVPQGDDHRVRPGVLRAHLAVRDAGQHFYRGAELLGRSEERRVGKGCRCRWAPYHGEADW